MNESQETTMSVRTDDRPNILMVSKDWGSSALWRRSTKTGNLANCCSYESFNFPDWLIRKLDFWSAWYEHNDPCEIEKTLDWPLWEAYGLALAIDIKRIVRDEYVVYYDPNREVPFIPFEIDSIPPRDDLDKTTYIR